MNENVFKMMKMSRHGMKKRRVEGKTVETGGFV